MLNIAFLVVIIASLVALLVVGTENIGSPHVAFATNRGINVQTDTNQDQGCEPAGGTSGITNACTAISWSGSTETRVTLNFNSCVSPPSPHLYVKCTEPVPPNNCNNIGCQSVTCDFSVFGMSGNCTTNKKHHALFP